MRNIPYQCGTQWWTCHSCKLRNSAHHVSLQLLAYSIVVICLDANSNMIGRGLHCRIWLCSSNPTSQHMWITWHCPMLSTPGGQVSAMVYSIALLAFFVKTLVNRYVIWFVWLSYTGAAGGRWYQLKSWQVPCNSCYCHIFIYFQ